MADALRNEPGTDVQVIDGTKGEFTVTVDGGEVARKGDALPPIDEILAAVRNATSTVGTGV